MVHVYKELIAPLIAIKTPKIRATIDRSMCSGADTPKDEKQADMVVFRI